LAASDAGRLKELLPLRYSRMLESPFAFLRGAANVMVADLATMPASGLLVQACGDAHLANFGIFGTPERNLVFDVNDFDETLPGPWEWDVMRLATSVVVAGRSSQFSDADAVAAASAAVQSYRLCMWAYARMRHLEVWYSQIKSSAVANVLPTISQATIRRRLKQARRRDNLQAFDRLTTVIDGQVRMIEDPPLLTHTHEDVLGGSIDELYRHYLDTVPDDRRVLLERYRIVDAARKVVGVGSVGTRCHVLLLLGNDDDDPLFLQVKEAVASVLEPHVRPSAYANHGQRVVRGQQLTQAASDLFLGWGRIGSRDFYLRQLRDMKGAVHIGSMPPDEMSAYAALCGWALARAHARTGDAVAISGYLGTGDVFDRAITAFAQVYADQTERDHQELVAAVRNGRIVADAGSLTPAPTA